MNTTNDSITGTKFNYLTVIELLGRDKHGGRLVKCLCKCGNIRTFVLSELRTGHTKSCGCIRGESLRDSYDALVGSIFDKLTVLSFNGYINGRRYWNCKCECGNDCVRPQSYLINKRQTVKSCGCLSWSGKIKDIVGNRYGRLTVTKYLGKDSKKRTIWECLCDCGKTVILNKTNLGKGTRSCGCLVVEMLRNPNRTNNVARSGEASLRGIYKRYKKGAYLRGIEFSLSKEEVADLIRQDCFYCNAKPANVSRAYYVKKDEFILSNGIDRVDNNDGYTKDNVVPCCKTCNIAKRDLSENEFYQWVINLFTNLKKKELI